MNCFYTIFGVLYIHSKGKIQTLKVIKGVKMMFMNITIGYEMDEEERNSILEENGCSVDDYDSEDEAYMEAAELKFNEGLGCSVELS